MAEIWLKSNFLCISMVSHPITSLSFTIATLVALIDPWRVWLDPWGLRFSGLSPRYALSFILCRGGALFRDWMPIGRNFNAVWHVLFRFWLAKIQRCTIWDRCVFVCVWDFTHTTIYLELFTRPKAVMQNTYDSRRILRRRFGMATPRKTANRQFSSFSGPTTAPANRAQKPAIRTQKPANGRKSGFLPWCVLTKCILSQQS